MAAALTYVVEIPPDECAVLLASSSLGRLGVVVSGRPEIFPVNHVYDRESGCIVFPTTDGTKQRAALDWPWVAFEVDGDQPEGGAAWSVLVVGRAEELTDPDEIARLAGQRHVLWRAGSGVSWLRIVPSNVTGRRISVSDEGIEISRRVTAQHAPSLVGGGRHGEEQHGYLGASEDVADHRGMPGRAVL
jgi:nitroimidazol reductase NimA-like FMN-containing flavoprotein (pyridoxamine 5'-phosphate oxidase superfamily)